jgi:uncharacterized protein (DUF2141 family)
MLNIAPVTGSLVFGAPAITYERPQAIMGVLCAVFFVLLPVHGSNAATLDKNTVFPGGGHIAGRVLDLVERYVNTSKPLGACDPGSTHDELVITLPEIKPLRGNIRLSLYSGDWNEWLEKGRRLVRFDMPVTAAQMTICVPLPFGAADYAVGLYHDVDADQNYDWPSESYGFSNDARPVFLGPPAHKQVVFPAGTGQTQMTINIRY